MRKLFSHISSNGVVFPRASPPTSAPAPYSSVSFPPLWSPTSSPAPPPLAESNRDSWFLLTSIPIDDGAFDLVTICLIAGLLLLCVISFSIIFHLCLTSRRCHHLQHFNSLWTTRLLLVFFGALWALNEVHRLAVFRREYLFPLLPPLSLYQQANFCKVHQVLSLGFFEPGFLVTLLFLVNVSIRKRLPSRMWALGSVCLALSPVFALQTLVVFFSPLETRLPKCMHESSILSTDAFGNNVVLCKYPLLSSFVFGAFAVAYLLAFLISSWKVAAFVINKNIRARINALASTIMLALPLQILCLALSALWTPDHPAYSWAELAIFLCGAWFVAFGEVILVITPITEALVAGGHCCSWRYSISSRGSEVGS